MKKIFLVTVFSAALVLSGCGQKTDNKNLSNIEEKEQIQQTDLATENNKTLFKCVDLITEEKLQSITNFRSMKYKPMMTTKGKLTENGEPFIVLKDVYKCNFINDQLQLLQIDIDCRASVAESMYDAGLTRANGKAIEGIGKKAYMGNLSHAGIKLKKIGFINNSSGCLTELSFNIGEQILKDIAKEVDKNIDKISL